jgi:ABC-2 type transport system permease protein
MNSRTQDLIIPDITAAGSKLSYFIDDVAKNGMKITLPRTSALEVSRNSVFKAEPIITSHSDSCWTELQTRDFVNDTARFDPATGERKGKFPLAVSLTRNVNKTTQKIIITGDADWLSNGELGTERKNIFSGNFNYLYGMIAYLNNGELPIDMRRPAPRDNKINLTTGQWGVISFFLKWLLPLALALTGTIIWFRRKRK